MPPSSPSSSPSFPSSSTTTTLCALTILGLLQAFALAVFMLGFFLTRQEVPHYSHCEDKALWPVVIPSSSFPSTHATCWSSATTPRFSKAIIVVIDALRFDFINPYDEEAFAERLHQEGTPDASYHLNKLPVVRELLSADPSRALLYRFEADPPTTTVQRLKGLTTGALPTFLDFRQNFHSPAIVEDNLIYQLKQAGKRLTFMGDDTWDLLFPGAFDRSFPFPSFNTRDLDTVDNGVIDHLLPELHRSFPASNTTSQGNEEGKEEGWDVLIAHFLGADHVGHTYGPSHPAMAGKLTQLDMALRTIVKAIGGEEGGSEAGTERIAGGKVDEDARGGASDGEGGEGGEGETLLIVMGDHGMTDDGNHGGASKDETEAALFLYSPGRGLISTAKAEAGGEKKEGVYIWEDEGAGRGVRGGLRSAHLEGAAVPRRVAQVDLVPTLSLLLGVAIPYPNLGGIIPELFFSGKEEGGGRAGEWQGLLHAFQANAYQLYRYLMKYGEVASLPSAEMEVLARLYRDAVSAHEEVAREGGGEEVMEGVCREYRWFLREALGLGRRIWTQYDVGLMLWGVLLLALSLLLGVVMMNGKGEGSASSPLFSSTSVSVGKGSEREGQAQRASCENTAPAAHDNGGDDQQQQQQQQQQQHHHLSLPSTSLLLPLFLGGLAAALVVSWVFPAHFLQQGNDHAATVIPCLVLSLTLIGVILSKLREGGREGWVGVGGTEEWMEKGSLLLVLLHGASLFSNSYIEGEEKTYLFLGGSAALLLWVSTTTSSSSSSSSSRSSEGIIYPTWLLPALLTRLAFAAKGHGQDVVAHFNLLLTLFPLLALLIAYHHLSSFSLPPSPLPSKRTIFLSFSYLLLFLHWLSQVDAQDFPLWASDILNLHVPRYLYLSSIFAFLFLGSSSDGNTRDRSLTNIRNFCLDVAALSLSPPLLLVLGPLAPWSLFCLAGTIYTLRRFCTRPSLHPSLPYLVSVSLLGRAYFFATGHHSQFNRLQYSAAFVGFDEFSFRVGGVLLFLNTFGTELMVVLMVGHEILATVSSSPSTAALSTYPPSLPSSFATLLHLSAFKTLMTTLCVLLHRRHLMVWAIFAPKLIFDACLHVVMSGACVGLLWCAWCREGERKRRGK